MPGPLNVEVLIGLRDQLSAPLRGVLSRLDSSAEALNAKLGRFASLTFIGGALQQSARQIVDPLRQAVGEAGALGSVLTEVGIVAEVSAQRLGAVRPELRALAEQTNQYTTDLAAGLKDLTARCLGFEDALAVLPGIAKATTAAKAALMSDGRVVELRTPKAGELRGGETARPLAARPGDPCGGAGAHQRPHGPGVLRSGGGRCAGADGRGGGFFRALERLPQSVDDAWAVIATAWGWGSSEMLPMGSPN